LRQHHSGEDLDQGSKQLFSDHVAPHFRSIFSDPPKKAVVGLGECDKILGVNCEVAAIEPEGQGWGVIDGKTEIYANLHHLPEFSRIHVVPFSDTLPSAYDYDVFTDYVKPFFSAHASEGFQEGQTFTHNGVQFKVVAAEPQRSTCRVGSATTIFTEGMLHPSAAELLTPEQARQLAVFPPSLQMLLLNTTMFGNGELADRIMEAQGQQRRARLNSSIIERETQEAAWDEGLASDQTECVVCLTNFEAGCRVRVLPCGHVFHTGCIDEWLGRDPHCPLCRTGLPTATRGSRRQRR